MARSLSLLVLGAGLAGCALVGSEQGIGSLAGPSLRVPDCHGVNQDAVFEPFSLSFELLGAQRDGDTLTYRLAASHALANTTDELVIEVAHLTSLLRELGASSGGQVSRPVGGAEVRVGLALLGRCSTSSAPLEAVSGTITFTELGTRAGQRVSARLRVDLAERRSGERVGEDLVGDLDFEVRVGMPFTSFSPKTF